MSREMINFDNDIARKNHREDNAPSRIFATDENLFMQPEKGTEETKKFFRLT
jgi:hypothetical protein